MGLDPFGTFSTTQILGVPVAQISLGVAVRAVLVAAKEDRRMFVCVTGVHGVMECQRDDKVMAAHRSADLVVPDGMPLVWVSRWRGSPHTTRVYGPDLFLDCCRDGVEMGTSHYLFGGGKGVADLLAEELQRRFTGIDVVGTHTPPLGVYDEDELDRQAEQINQVAPDVVWVGLSTPKQEQWMARMRGRLNAAALVGVGAAFDFIPGLKPQAPRWMGRVGLEWLFRLGSEPRRLGRRYLINNPSFVWRILTERPEAP